ncbi:UDP-glycosyltransferase 89a2 [Phtheirospermum japonicum]|uniref:UDP-glycosyltransferase 89a2 n=1 Tax=Phtheirospermum japonicum TaxID=374723 RepID=A0A830CHE9_9LAMI|nr:UDP-glycosyltransferase 89a2 [Phtheirospermum japonicum]
MMDGVMILGWPMEADQFVNVKLLVEYNGAAVVVCQGGKTVPDSDELSRKIAESMHGDDGPLFFWWVFGMAFWSLLKYFGVDMSFYSSLGPD